MKEAYERHMEQSLDASAKIQARKMHQFCEIMIREFKYMNKLQEDKILFEVGYRDTLGQPEPHAGPGELYDEVMSVKSQIPFSW